MQTAVACKFKEKSTDKWWRTGIALLGDPEKADVICIVPGDATGPGSVVMEVWEYILHPAWGSFTIPSGF